MGKVRFGLHEVRYALYDETDDSYSAPVNVPGSVKMTIETVGEDSTFFADNVAYETFSSNGGYTGSLEFAVAEDQLLQDLLGFEIDDKGMVYEPTDAKAKSFALMYKVDSNAADVRFCYFNCKASRPKAEANTKSDSVSPDTTTLDFKAIGRNFTIAGVERNVVKGHIENTTANAANYAAWAKAVPVPTVAAA